jgi:hypothetical protein
MNGLKIRWWMPRWRAKFMRGSFWYIVRRARRSMGTDAGRAWFRAYADQPKPVQQTTPQRPSVAEFLNPTNN